MTVQAATIQVLITIVALTAAAIMTVITIVRIAIVAMTPVGAAVKVATDEEKLAERSASFLILPCKMPENGVH